MTWIEPETLTVHRGVSVYRTYKNECADSRLTYWYTTDLIGDEDFEFDVRELPVPEGVEPENHALVIAHAIDQSLIELSDGTDIEPENRYRVRADIRSTEFYEELQFDAADWLLEAPVEAIAALQASGWCEEATSSAMVRWLEIRNYKVGGFAHGTRTASSDNDLRGFEVVIKPEDAESFLHEYNPEKYGEVMHRNKRALKVSGVVEEVVTIEKSVSGYLLIDEPEFQSCLFDSETGEDIENGVLDLRLNSEFDEKLATFLREAAYEQLITDGKHGWEVSGSEGPVIDKVDVESTFTA
jgi:hypothetical protein